jgi:hypothetical protein
MKHNRRNFLKHSSMGIAGATMLGATATSAAVKSASAETQNVAPTRSQTFNMSGYAAPKLDVVRIGFIGLGNRGPGAVSRMNKIDGVSIKGLCDLRPERAAAALKILDGSGHKPDLYTDKEDAWKKMCDRNDIDLIYIATPWSLHAPMAVYAMNQGKHVCIEVPAAKTVEECWQLVETSERTKKHCMILENCCYDFFRRTTRYNIHWTTNSLCRQSHEYYIGKC